jgi:competence protein ComFB
MSVTNIMESIVEEIFQTFQLNYALKCNCNQCKDDILSLTLNRIPPKYVSSSKGGVYVRTYFMNEQSRMDILKEIANAVTIVEKNPHHVSV